MTGPARRGRVVVAGLGPAGPELLTVAAGQALARIPQRFLRTTRHPSAPAAQPAVSFDALYRSAATLEEVYAGIVEALVAAAGTHGEVLYAVPGSPVVAERSVELLRGDGRVEVEVLPALSFLDLAWDRLGVDPLAAGVRLVDGHRFAVEAAGDRGPMLVAQCDSRLVLSEIKLALDDGAEAPAGAVVLQRLGLPDERVAAVGWDDLDRAVDPDHLTAVYLPALAAPVGAGLVRLAEVVRTLRERCPWDREQTHASLTRYVLEEAYEVVEAVESGDADHLAEELGDLLLQVFLHAAIAAQAGDFTLSDVARGITDKMVRRHPHVFGDVVVGGADDVRRNWEQIKQAEQAEKAGGAGDGDHGAAPGPGGGGALDGVEGWLPALLHAARLGRRAARAGFDWPSVEGVYAKVAEELDELRREPTAEELGDVLLAVVNLARHLGHDPEAALRGASGRFRRRFAVLERLAWERGVVLDPADGATLDRLWEEAKRRTARSGS